MTEYSEVAGLYGTIIAWSVIPSFLTSFIHNILLFLRLVKAQTQPQRQRQRQYIHTALLLIYACSEMYNVHSGLQGQSRYDTLNVNPWTAQKQLKPSYRRLSLLYHPDKVSTFSASDGKEEEVYIKIRRAYDTLSDPLRETIYFRTGMTECSPQSQSSPSSQSSNCRTMKDWLVSYGYDAAVFYLSLLIALSVYYMLSKDLVGAGHRLAVVGVVLGIEMGISAGSFSHLTPALLKSAFSLIGIPAFHYVLYLRKFVVVYVMLMQQLTGIWNDKPPITIEQFLQRLQESSDARMRSLDVLGSRLFLSPEFNDRCSATLRQMLKQSMKEQ